MHLTGNKYILIENNDLTILTNLVNTIFILMSTTDKTALVSEKYGRSWYEVDNDFNIVLSNFSVVIPDNIFNKATNGSIFKLIESEPIIKYTKIPKNINLRK